MEQNEPTAAMRECPVRSRCLLDILTNSAGYRCGFEQADTIAACPKRERLEGR